MSSRIPDNSYFRISSSADGIYVTKLTKAELEQWINEEWDQEHETILTRIKESDPNYWGEACLLIKGVIVIPIHSHWGIE